MADKDTARDALYEAIEATAKKLKDGNEYSAGPALRDLAWAWRALVGGTQPGSSVVEK